MGSPPGIPFRVTRRQILAFAEFSGDTNPLHVDVDYARTTPFADVITHGALASLMAISVSRASPAPGARIEAHFLGPIYPDQDYTLQTQPTDASARSAAENDAPMITVTILDGQRVLLRIQVTACPDGARFASSDNPIDESITDYRPDIAGIQDLLVQAGGARISDGVALAFSAASMIVGMHHPGRQALLRTVSVTTPLRSSSAQSWGIDLSLPSAAGERRGLIGVTAAIRDDHGPYLMLSTRALRRPEPVTVMDTGPRTTELAGHVSVVVGSSRGLGWSLARELDRRGADVVGIQRTTTSLNPFHVAVTDAQSPGDLEAVSADVRARFGAVDSLFLVATGPLRDMWVDEAHRPRIEDYLRNELELILRPLTAFLPQMAPNGRILLASSEVLGPAAALDPVARGGTWPHYVTAKAMAEALVHVVGLENPSLKCHILRLPAMNTALVHHGGLQTVLEPAACAEMIVDALVSQKPAMPFEAR